MKVEENKNKYKVLINVLSIVIPVVVAILLGIPNSSKIQLGDWTKALPHFNGVLNSVTALFLLIGYYFVKKGNLVLHERMMKSAFYCGALFLLTYVLYHVSNESTHYGNEGTIRYIYFFLLISHILLSVAVVPLVLLAIFYALTKQIEDHKRIVKYTFPVWMYVSVSGVVVYLMISPYYQ